MLSNYVVKNFKRYSYSENLRVLVLKDSMWFSVSDAAKLFGQKLNRYISENVDSKSNGVRIFTAGDAPELKTTKSGGRFIELKQLEAFLEKFNKRLIHYKWFYEKVLPELEEAQEGLYVDEIGILSKTDNDSTEDLVSIVSGEAMTSTLKVAQRFNRNHKDVLKLLSELVRSATVKSRIGGHYHESTYKDTSGKDNKMYYMDKDGFLFLAMSFKGKKANIWKLDFIDAFNKMADMLQQTQMGIYNQIEQKKLEVNQRLADLQEQYLELQKEQTTIQKAEMWLKMGAAVNDEQYKRITNAYASEALTGKKVLALPEVTEKTLSATDVGNLLGISCIEVGKIANKNNLKTPEYGKWFYDLSRDGSRQVETFRYYEKAIDKFRKLIINYM